MDFVCFECACRITPALPERVCAACLKGIQTRQSNSSAVRATGNIDLFGLFPILRQSGSMQTRLGLQGPWLKLILLIQLYVVLPHELAGQTLSDLERYADQLAQQRLFAGMLHVDQGGSTVLSKGFGLASYELDVPMRNDHRYPIGSNTKLFTAVALWQLHRAGKLSVYDPASKYLDHTELGLEGPWCPRVFGSPETGPCQQPQIQHLLRMSGGVLGFDNCAYKAEAWQQQYCLGSPKSPSSFTLPDYQSMQVGSASIADYLRLTGTLRLPLEFEPGSGYHYSNPGYALAGYIIEKVSGQPLADYFRVNFFQKYGLSSTLYDVSNGVIGIHRRELPFPAYITYLQPGELDAVAAQSNASINQLTASTGDPRYWGGDARSDNSEAKLSSDSMGAVSVGMTAKHPGPSGWHWGLANAAGAIVSTPQDMAKWFRALLVDQNHLGLGKELLKEFLSLSTDVPGMPDIHVKSSNSKSSKNATLVFAQGLIVMKDPQNGRGLGVSNVYYIGSLGGFQAMVYMWLHPEDSSKDVFVNAVAATVLPDKSLWPKVAQNLTEGQCMSGRVVPSTGSSRPARTQEGPQVVGGRRRMHGTLAASDANSTSPRVDVLGVLCDLSSMMPSAMKTLPDVLGRIAFKALTGRDWFDIE